MAFIIQSGLRRYDKENVQNHCRIWELCSWPDIGQRDSCVGIWMSSSQPWLISCYGTVGRAWFYTKGSTLWTISCLVETRGLLSCTKSCFPSIVKLHIGGRDAVSDLLGYGIFVVVIIRVLHGKNRAEKALKFSDFIWKLITYQHGNVSHWKICV